MKKTSLRFMQYVKMFVLVLVTIAATNILIAKTPPVAPTVIYSTEPLAAGNVMQGTYPGVILYVLKIQASTDPANVSWITFTPTGSFTNTDISQYSLYWNTTNSFTGATLTQSVSSGTGSGVSKTINAGSTNIPVGQARYFFIVAAITSTAVDGHTIKVNGSTNPVTADIFPAPIIVNNQTDIAGVQTITAPKPTVSTEALPASNVLQGSNNTPIYIVKIEATSGQLDFNSLKIKTLGTYTSTDVSYFQIFKGSTNSFASATYLGYHGFSITGSGQTITLGGYGESIPMGQARYYFITANISATGIDGRTIKVDGSANPLEIVSSTTIPVIVNNQTDVAGVQTITAPKPTVSTEALPASNVLQGSTNNPIYIVKIVATSGPLVFSSLKIKTLGTYTASDVSYFQIFKGSTNLFASATYLGYHGFSITGSGQTITLGGYGETIPAGETRYYFITANISATGIDGRTIKVDGSANPLEIAGNTTPVIVNNQTDAAGIQTIVAPKVTYTTESVPPLNVLQNEPKVLVYILKIASTTHYVNVGTISYNITGNYTNNDVQYFQVSTNVTNTLTGATVTGTNTSTSTGTGEVFLQGAAATIPVGESRYFFLTALLKPTSTAGRTIKVNGSANPIVVGFNNTSPIITNNQTDIAGKQTIGTPLFTYTTESSTAKIIAKGTANHPFYTLKVVGGTVGGTITNLAIQTSGTYNSTDIGSFTLFKNSVPSTTGATLVATDNTSTGTGETLTFPTGYVEIDAGTTTYLIVRANVNAAATSGNTFFINGGANPITTTNSGLVATITNSQTNVAGIQTIGVPPTFTSVISNIAANTTASLCTAVANYTPTVSGFPTPTLSYSFTGATTGSGAGSGSGGVFSRGVTNVVLTATNGCLPDATQSFTVTISDVQLPTITAPANVTATTNPACTATGVVLGTPTTADNCSVATTTNNAPTAFPLGVTTVVWTVTDGSGNVKTANQTVTVTDNVLPTITAPANVNATTNTACTATGVLLGTPTTADNCSVASTTNNAPTAFPLGVTTVVWTVTDGAGNVKTASQTVTVTDNILPTITAPSNVTTAINTACTATSVVLGTPTTADNCSVASATNNAPTAFPVGITTVVWTVTDGAGNIKTANQTVTVTENILPTITAPANVTATTNTACTATGVVLGTPITADNCSVASTTNNAPTAFPLGVTTVVWTVTDGSGNVKTANQTVTVTDNILPTITAPANVTANTNTACTATGVVLGTPTTADNCSVASTTNNAPTAFPLGVTTVVWTVTDGAGNVKTASQTVTVVDTTPPATPTLANVTGACSVTPGIPTTTDNCSATINGTTTTTFPITTLGTTVVVWTFVDGNGNSITANQNVIVSPIANPTSVNAVFPSVLPGQTSTLTASGCPSNSYKWKQGSVTVSSVASFTTPPLTASTTYTAFCVNGTCESAGTNITVTTTNCPPTLTLSSTNNPTDDTATGTTTKKASANTGGLITATNKITGTANVTYEAKNIQLNPGFRADGGTVFLAQVGGCN